MKRPEEAVHRSISALLQWRLQPPWIYFHCPNGGGRSKAEAGILKALGVRAGMPDLCLVGDGRMVCLEIKSRSGRLSTAQRETIGRLAEAGVPTLIVRSLDEAIEALRSLGVPLRGGLQ